MVIRKPIKRGRVLFSDAVKSDDYEKTSNEVYNRRDAKYPRSVDLEKVTTKPKLQINKKISTIDMGNYVEVSLTHLVNGGSQSCLKKIYSGGSDLKIGCAWPQFKGHHIDAIDRVEDSINWTYHTRHDDQIAKASYLIFDKIEDATKFMALKLDYGNKQIDRYQTIKPEEDITVINVPNYRDVGIISMIKIIKEQIERLATIFDICAWCKKNGHWKSDCEVLNKIINEKKARKSASKMGFVFKSTETEKTVGLESTAPTIKNLPFVTAATTKTNDGDKKAAEAKKLESNDGSGSSHTTSVRTIKETDGYKESSDYERSSSPIEIKKEHIIFNSNQSDSYCNKTPSEHSSMAGKARLGLIPQNEFLNYVSSIDRAPQGANVANMELDSIPLGDTGADTEMRQNTD
ncbi:hypothetical protein AYI70_g2255 [Smittium culicis]|uniref:CCHC-type domain-containing protein n=1 Tax=Smittium culicis TaxID=133412 RepID=A0A1R1Y925_9FUNG|nr:hypothetical protein AYI70_g2255 [Smittium culicis]